VAAEHFDALIIGGGVTDANASRVEKGVRALPPEIAVQRTNLSREPLYLYWLKKAPGSRKTL